MTPSVTVYRYNTTLNIWRWEVRSGSVEGPVLRKGSAPDLEIAISQARGEDDTKRIERTPTLCTSCAPRLPTPSPGGLLTSQGVSNQITPSQIKQADFSAGYLTADEVCSLIHVSRATLYRLIRAGHLPTGRLPSGCRRIGAADVQRFMKTIAQGAQT